MYALYNKAYTLYRCEINISKLCFHSTLVRCRLVVHDLESEKKTSTTFIETECTFSVHCSNNLEYIKSVLVLYQRLTVNECSFAQHPWLYTVYGKCFRWLHSMECLGSMIANCFIQQLMFEWWRIIVVLVFMLTRLSQHFNMYLIDEHQIQRPFYILYSKTITKTIIWGEVDHGLIQGTITAFAWCYR